MKEANEQTISPSATDQQAKPTFTQQQRRRTLFGALLVIISAICWGVSGVCSQYLTQSHGVQVEWINCVRMTIPALVLLPYCLVRRDTRVQVRRMLTTKRDLAGVIIYAIFGCFACQIGYLFTISYTTAGTATMMEQAGMIIVVAVTCIRERRYPTRREIIALFLALAGTSCICSQGDFGSLAMPPEGLAWGIVACISMATYVLLPVRLVKSYSGIVVTAVALTVAAIFCCVLFQPQTRMPELIPEVLWGTAGTVVLGVIVAYIAFLEGVKRCGAIFAGLLDAIEPVAALAGSAIFLGTFISAFDALGCVFIIGMMILVTLPEKTSQREQKE